MEAHEFIRKTFNLDNGISISELPDLPIPLIVEMLNNYKEGKVKKLLIPCQVSVLYLTKEDDGYYKKNSISNVSGVGIIKL